MSRIRTELRAILPLTLDAVERFCADFQAWRAEVCSELDAFAAELLLREALTNSVVHGGGMNRCVRVYCVLRAKRNRLIIAIQDGGQGFDWRAGWDRLADPEDTHGRGVEILRQYANAVRFNPSGNAVTLIKAFEGKNTHE